MVHLYSMRERELYPFRAVSPTEKTGTRLTGSGLF